MTRQEAKRLLRRIQRTEGHDPEAAHLLADRVLCDLLTDLGYKDVIYWWEQVEKWYS